MPTFQEAVPEVLNDTERHLERDKTADHRRASLARQPRQAIGAIPRLVFWFR